MIDKSDFQVKIGEHIRKNREAKGFSGAELAKLLEMDRPNLHKLENGGYSPSLYLLTRIAHTLDLTIIEFLNDFEY